MGAAFTPGPWEVDPSAPADVEAANGSICIALGGEIVDGSFYFNGAAASQAAQTEEERLANARLIAAAPELYEEGKQSQICLEEVAAILASKGLPGIASLMRAQAERQRAALTKATAK